jgi:hypothetical protein
MSSYILSTANRFYAAVESGYGQIATITSADRIPALRFHAHQTLQTVKRNDKTGGRTFQGVPSTAQRATAFEIDTFLSSWNGTGEPPCSPLFRAACGASPRLSAGQTVLAVQGTQLQTMTDHRLSFGSAVSYKGEIRFVTDVSDQQTVALNAPFNATPGMGETLAPAITYPLGTQLPSLTIFDYWDPITAVSRFVSGAAVDALRVSIKGDIHEFTFSGPAADLVDSSNADASSTNAYPAEPELLSFDYAVVPGQLGELWLGNPTSQFFTLTGASIVLSNGLQTRGREYGSAYPLAVSSISRTVVFHFALLAQDDAQTVSLYNAAKQHASVPAMLQLGRQQGQLMAAFMPKVTPELPIYNDSNPQLEWEFSNSHAEGFANDELFIAFA